jgi:hypothetical protein
MRKIIFFSTIIGVADAFPVIKAGEYRPTWIAGARQKYEEKKEKMDGAKFFHVYRCPGIFDLMNQGYIVTCPWDVTIETRGDGADFRWRTPEDEELRTLLGDHPVQGHMADAIADSLPIKPGRLKSIIKFTTSWNVIAPEGVKFLIVPIPYPDSYEFESTPGILDSSISSELNAQLYWNKLEGRHTVLAGTPLFQLIPLTDEKFEVEVRNATPSDLDWVKRRRYFLNISFGPKRGFLKNLYNKIWHSK